MADDITLPETLPESLEYTEDVQTIPEVTDFDNEILLLYKWGKALQTPIRYIIYRRATPEDRDYPITHFGGQDLIFESLINIMYRLLESLTLRESFEILLDLAPNVTMDDMIMLYVTLELSQENTYPEIFQTLQKFFTDEDIIEATQPKIRQLPKVQRFTNVDDLKIRHQYWIEEFNRMYNHDIQLLEEKLAIIDQLIKLDPLPVSDLQIDKIHLEFQPTINENPVTLDDGIDIFNSCLVSSDIPYIQYNSSTNDNRYYKIFHNSESDPISKVSELIGSGIIPSRVKTQLSDTIYATISTKDIDNPSVKNSGKATSKSSYSQLIYDLTKNKLTFEAPIIWTSGEQVQNETAIIKRVEKSFPTISLNKPKETKISGSFNVYNIDITEYILIDMILNYPLMNTYLYIEESQKSVAEKDRVFIHYKALTTSGVDEEGGSTAAAVSINIKQMNVESGMEMEGTPYLRVQIMKASSAETARQFVEIFRRLLQFYKENRQDVENYYKYFIPEPDKPEIVKFIITPKARPGAPAVLKTGNNASNIQALQAYAPDVIIEGQYAKDCQSSSQPIGINKDEISQWTQDTFITNDGTVMHRQILEYPPGEPIYYFVCPNDKYPYPGVKVNTSPKNRDKYPYIPCCYATDHMDPKKNSAYNVYYRGSKKKVASTKHNPLIIKKTLVPGRLGQLPITIRDLLTNYRLEDTDDHEIIRFGIPQNPNSLIHAILTAINYQPYLDLSDEHRDSYVLYIRSVILGLILSQNDKTERSPTITLMKQELYDLTEEEITKRLSDPNIYFDPSYYYRVLEELFNINIYVFSPFDDLDENNGKISLPRAKIFHARPPRPERFTVLIYEHNYGTNPQCELIVDHDKSSNTFVKIFGPEMTSVVHNALLDTYTNITWRISPYDDIVNGINLYSRINFPKLVQDALDDAVLSHQVIDEYGKMRALIVSLGQNQMMTLVVPPSQPINLPNLETEIPKISGDIVLKLVGSQPIAVTRSDQNLIDGIWYQVMDLEFGVYIPIVPSQIRSLSELPTGIRNPLSDRQSKYRQENITNDDVVNRIRRLEKTLNIFLQLMKWTYLISQQTPEQFYMNYFALDGRKITDSSTYYDFSQLPRKLPQVNSIDEAITFLSEKVPTLVQNGRIVLYNETLAGKVYQRLVEFEKYQRPSLKSIPINIEKYFWDEKDFKKEPYTLIFTNERDLQLWLASVARNGLNLRNRLEPSLALHEEPYLYQSPDGKIYLIQNVTSGEFLPAINIANTWYQQRINLGPYAEPYDNQDDIPVHAIYGISPDGVATVREDKTNKNAVYLQILMYGEIFDINSLKFGFRIIDVQQEKLVRYAAMLPLI